MKKYDEFLLLLSNYEIENMVVEEKLKVLNITRYKFYKEGGFKTVVSTFIKSMFDEFNIEDDKSKALDRNFIKNTICIDIFNLFSSVYSEILVKNMIYLKEILINTFIKELEILISSFKRIKQDRYKLSSSLFLITLSNDLFLAITNNDIFPIITRIY